MKKISVTIISLLLISLFAYAAITKLSDYYNFRFGLSESPFIGRFYNILAWLIPATELVIAGMLLLPLTRMAGLYASFFLMTLFTIYIAAMLTWSAEIPCSCGGVLEEMSWGTHIVFNSFFILISVIGIILLRKIKTGKPNHSTIDYAEGNFSTT